MGFLGDELGERAPTARDPCGDRAEREVEALGDRGVAEALGVEELKGPPLPLREAPERACDQGRALGHGEGVVGAEPWVGEALNEEAGRAFGIRRGVTVLVASAVTAPRAKRVERHVPSDPEEPRAHRPGRRRAALDRTPERLLRRVLHVGMRERLAQHRGHDRAHQGSQRAELRRSRLDDGTSLSRKG